MTSEKIHLVSSPTSWIDQQAIDQLRQTSTLPGIDRAVGLPDLHAGRGIPVGAAFWSRSHIYPHLVGNDIGCGMALWQSDFQRRKFKIDRAVKKLNGLDEPWPGDHGERLNERNLPASLAGDALGTIGGGNHFAELQQVDQIVDPLRFRELGFDEACLQLLVHSGSRGLGQAILQKHLRDYGSQGLVAGGRAFSDYLTEHDQAMSWARLNRDIIADRFLARLNMHATPMLDIFHNSVTPHQDGWLHRKGAAPADKGPIVIPGSRGAMTYLVQPTAEGADISLHSLAHGAGRKWKRTDAKDKLVRRYTVSDLERTDLGGRVICEDKNLIYEEAPQAYKDIGSVIDDLRQAGLISVIAILRPLITYKTRRT